MAFFFGCRFEFERQMFESVVLQRRQRQWQRPNQRELLHPLHDSQRQPRFSTLISAVAEIWSLKVNVAELWQLRSSSQTKRKSARQNLW